MTLCKQRITFKYNFYLRGPCMAENTEIIERINFYVRQKGGNKSALARDWGVHPSHLTVVLKGQRNVSPTMLMNAVKNGYNTEWLMKGEGEPYLPTSAVEKEQATDLRDELLASKDEVIALLKEKNALLEQQLKKDLGTVTKRTNSKIVPLRTDSAVM